MPLVIDGVVIEKLFLNGVEKEGIYLDGVQVFAARVEFRIGFPSYTEADWQILNPYTNLWENIYPNNAYSIPVANYYLPADSTVDSVRLRKKDAPTETRSPSVLPDTQLELWNIYSSSWWPASGIANANFSFPIFRMKPTAINPNSSVYYELNLVQYSQHMTKAVMTRSGHRVENDIGKVEPTYGDGAYRFANGGSSGGGPGHTYHFELKDAVRVTKQYHDWEEQSPLTLTRA